MAFFTVVDIINGNTIQVQPGWVWGNSKGDLVQINGYKLSSQYDSFAKNKLITLIKGKQIELKNATVVSKDSNNIEVIFCSVFLNEIDVSQYFPELKSA